MNTRNEVPDVRQAQHVATRRRSRRWIFGIGGLAIATAAAAVLAITLPADTEEEIRGDVPTATQPPTSAVTDGREELVGAFTGEDMTGVARFVRTGEPGTDDEWTVELDVTFIEAYRQNFSGAERIVLRLSPGLADPEQAGSPDVCSAAPPDADGRATCTGTFPASVIRGAEPFGTNWTAWVVALFENGTDQGITQAGVGEPIDADLAARFSTITHIDAVGYAHFRHEDDGTWTGWVDVQIAEAVGPVWFQVGLPNTDGTIGHHVEDVCEVVTDADGNWSRCTGTFSGTASDTWSSFGTGSVALLRAPFTSGSGTPNQANVYPLAPCSPASTFKALITTRRAIAVNGCAAPNTRRSVAMNP